MLPRPLHAFSPAGQLHFAASSLRDTESIPLRTLICILSTPYPAEPSIYLCCALFPRRFWAAKIVPPAQAIKLSSPQPSWRR